MSFGRRIGVGCLVGLAWVAAARAAVPGDANCDERVDDSDLVALTTAVFEGSLCAGADANADGRLSSADFPSLIGTLAQPTPTPTETATRTATFTVTPTPTASLTASPSETTTATATPTPTPSETDTPTVTATATATSTPTLPPCPPDGAALTFVLDNPAGIEALDVAVSGYRLAASCQAAPELALTYDTAGRELPPRLTGLAPGVWVHTVQVHKPETGQVQHRETLLLSAGAGDNEARFTVFPAVATVRTVEDGVAADSLRDALTTAQAAPKPFLIQFADAAFPAGVKTTITLASALPRLQADDVTIDGIDATGAAGMRIVDAAGLDIPALSIAGARNRVIGLGLTGAGGSNRDVLSINGAGAWGNRIERCTVTTATTGDGIGIDDNAGMDLAGTANVVIRSAISGAADKGIKVTTGAYARIEESLIRDNRNGGIQVTLGGRVLARDNIVEENTGPDDTARNGISANGGDGVLSELATNGNIVRRNGANGIVVLGTARAELANDYLAANATAGLRVYNRGSDAATAIAQGLAAACNGTHGASVEDTSGVDFGGPSSAGHNAFTQNGRSGAGDNFRNATAAPVMALNNQWEQCGRSTVCDDGAVAAYDISDHGVHTAFVPAQAHRSQRAPVVTAARPLAGRAGELVRLFGTGFNAIDGHSNDAQCVDLETRNSCSPLRGNCVLIDGVEARVEAVTPTMLAVRMPFACVEPVSISVRIQGGGTSTPFTLCTQPDGAAATEPPQE